MMTLLNSPVAILARFQTALPPFLLIRSALADANEERQTKTLIPYFEGDPRAARHFRYSELARPRGEKQATKCPTGTTLQWSTGSSLRQVSYVLAGKGEGSSPTAPTR